MRSLSCPCFQLLLRLAKKYQSQGKMGFLSIRSALSFISPEVCIFTWQCLHSIITTSASF